MLTSLQLQHLAGAATLLRAQVEPDIHRPTTIAGITAQLGMTHADRLTQLDLTAVCAHLAKVSALLHRSADRLRPAEEQG